MPHLLTEKAFDPKTDQRSAPGMIEVNVTDATHIDAALGNAIEEVTACATQHRIGILITRIGVGSYIVRAHPSVPYGLTRQKYA